MSFKWYPSLEAMEEDQREYDHVVQTRRETMLADHNDCGCPHNIWLNDKRYVAQLNEGISAWVEQRGGMVSYESWSGEVLTSFKKPCDAILFKLMYGGQ